MKKFLLLALLAFAAIGTVSTVQAENRVVGQYSFGANDFPDTWGFNGEYDLISITDFSNFYVGVGFTDSASGGLFDGTVYRGTVGVQFDVAENYLIKVGYAYDWADGDLADTYAGTLAGVYQGDLWRFQVALTKPSGVDVFYGTSAEREVFDNFAVGVAGQFNGSDYVLTTVYGAYTF